MRRSALFGLAAAALLSAASVAAAEGLRWQLGFRHATPTWIKVQDAGESSTVRWYMTYTVENRTGEARKPVIRAEIRTDTGKTFGDTGDPRTIAAFKKAANLDEVATFLDLRKGIEDGKAVKCIATFGRVDDYATKLELRVYGLEDPVTMVKGKQVFEVRYWSVQYERKGDEFRRTEDPWKTVSSGWVVEAPKEEKK